MRRTLAKWLVAGALAGFGLLIGAQVASAQTSAPSQGGPTAQDITDSDAFNVQEGENEGTLTQEGAATSGDPITGQVVGVKSGGGATVNAKNRSEDTDARSGSATSSNTARAFVGLASASDDIEVGPDDIDDSDGDNVQEGDNELSLSQSSLAVTGDAVSGQVIGVVNTSGEVDITAASDVEDADAETGEADAANDSSAFVGLADSDDGDIEVEEVQGSTSSQTQTGDATSALGTTPTPLGSTLSSGGGTGTSSTTGDASSDADPGTSGTGSGPQTSGLLSSEQGNLETRSRAGGDDPAIGIEDIDDSDGDNVQEGDNEMTLVQAAEARSGDGVVGQVIGVVSGGDTVVNATSSVEDADVESGSVDADNEANSFVGLADADDDIEIDDITDSDADNVQEGDNDFSLSQSIVAASGDAVGGQVIGVVTSMGASADVTASNRSEDVDAETGEVENAFNDANSFIGLAFADEGEIDISDIDDSGGDNVQEGDNEATIAQRLTASTGDAIAGQVIGIVASGDASVNASNETEDADAESGEVEARNNAETFTGLANADEDVEIDDIDDSDADNVQEGDNEAAITQRLTASTGDSVGGQVIGVVAGGDASVDASNESEDVDAETGDIVAENDNETFVGLAFSDEDDIEIGDIDDSGGDNVQEGDNDLSLRQSIDADTGDAIGGSVIGVVASGTAEVTASNSSEDIDAETGDVEADNEANTFTGLANADDDVDIDDIDDSAADNVQEGDNDATIAQRISTSTGDAVGGQVVGVVAGSASVDASNTSEDVDAETGAIEAENEAATFVGLAFADEGDIEISDIDDSGDDNVQEGDNDLTLRQSIGAATGDALGGQTVGVVTSRGSADVTASNESEDVDAETGEVEADNESGAFVGLANADDDVDVDTGDIDDSAADNVQEGDNDATITQRINASTGDAVGGQVIGIVAAGHASVDASNRSEDVDAESGEADASNASAAFVGLAFADGGDIFIGDIEDSNNNDNVQEGDNDLSHNQSVDAHTGDAVGGAVIGVVARWDVDIVASNESEDVDAETGHADATNDATLFVGLASAASDVDIDIDDITDADDGSNVQEGDNELSGRQTADATTGDAVAGMVLGVVAGGDVTADATNSSEDSDTETGDSTADNTAFAFIGLSAARGDIELNEIDDSDGENVQEGDNEFSFGQTADANSGDAVGGQIAGIVAGGTADLTLDNEVEDGDARTGESTQTNDTSIFAGLSFALEDVIIADLFGALLQLSI